MNAPARNFETGARSRSAGLSATVDASATSMRWAALCEAEKVVAMMAGPKAEPSTCEIRDFPVRVRECEPWRQELIDNGCADLAAMMEPGMATLLAINARGANCAPAALALWHEFVAARSALLALLPDADGEQHRSA